MTENMKLWLKSLYQQEIEEHKVAASNERLWSLGSDTDEQAMMHMENAKEHWEFIDILNQMMEEI
jgi:hypothetical protein